MVYTHGYMGDMYANGYTGDLGATMSDSGRTHTLVDLREKDVIDGWQTRTAATSVTVLFSYETCYILMLEWRVVLSACNRSNAHCRYT
jgi:hypothetical protein